MRLDETHWHKERTDARLLFWNRAAMRGTFQTAGENGQFDQEKIRRWEEEFGFTRRELLEAVHFHYGEEILLSLFN